MYSKQFSLFADDAMNADNWMLDPETNEPVPKPIKTYPSVHYRKIWTMGE